MSRLEEGAGAPPNLSVPIPGLELEQLKRFEFEFLGQVEFCDGHVKYVGGVASSECTVDENEEIAVTDEGGQDCSGQTSDTPIHVEPTNVMCQVLSITDDSGVKIEQIARSRGSELTIEGLPGVAVEGNSVKECDKSSKSKITDMAQDRSVNKGQVRIVVIKASTEGSTVKQDVKGIQEGPGKAPACANKPHGADKSQGPKIKAGLSAFLGPDFAKKLSSKDQKAQAKGKGIAVGNEENIPKGNIGTPESRKEDNNTHDDDIGSVVTYPVSAYAELAIPEREPRTKATYLDDEAESQNTS